ncbi:MAG: hypothetical protein ACLURV_02195 [Gallintestinimicrobium sp.]
MVKYVHIGNATSHSGYFPDHCAGIFNMMMIVDMNNVSGVRNHCGAGCIGENMALLSMPAEEIFDQMHRI